jgi:hypothetical protein
MKRYLPIFAALGIGLMSNTFVPWPKASESGEKTIITISQAIALEGTVLSLGRYAMRAPATQPAALHTWRAIGL